MGGRCCTLAYDGRARLSTVATVHNLLTSFAGKVLVSWALFIKFGLESRVATVLNNKGGALSYYLMAIGSLMFFIQLAAIKVMYDAGTKEGAIRRLCRLLVVVQAMEVTMVLLHLSGAILCLLHIKLIKDAFHTGVIAAIKLYRDKLDVKQAVDKIQMSFRCCGSSSMEDWFKISWVSLSYVNVKHPDVERYLQNGEFIKDDAPFSCCDMNVPRPCVHHDVLNVTAHRFVGTSGTLYVEGCSYTLIAFWKTYVIFPTLAALLVLAVMHLLSIILARLLQTSLEEALDFGDPFGKGDAYCCRKCPCAILPSGDPSKVINKKAAVEANAEDTDDTKNSYSSATTDSRGEDFEDLMEPQQPTGREQREMDGGREGPEQHDRHERKTKTDKKGKQDKKGKKDKKKDKKKGKKSKSKKKGKKKKKKSKKMKKSKRPKARSKKTKKRR